MNSQLLDEFCQSWTQMWPTQTAATRGSLRCNRSYELAMPPEKLQCAYVESVLATDLETLVVGCCFGQVMCQMFRSGEVLKQASLGYKTSWFLWWCGMMIWSSTCLFLLRNLGCLTPRIFSAPPGSFNEIIYWDSTQVTSTGDWCLRMLSVFFPCTYFLREANINMYRILHDVQNNFTRSAPYGPTLQQQHLGASGCTGSNGSVIDLCCRCPLEDENKKYQKKWGLEPGLICWPLRLRLFEEQNFGVSLCFFKHSSPTSAKKNLLGKNKDI